MHRPNGILPESDIDEPSGRTRSLAPAVSAMAPDELIAMVEAADLRGRGGAWFPTAEKWRTTRRHRSVLSRSTLVVNAAEGEPGSYKDRLLVQRDPFSVVDGALVAARAVEADTIVFATKDKFTATLERLHRAVRAVERGLETPDIVIVEGPDRYLFGEESALLEVVAGRGPFPRVGPPWRHGIDDAGTEGRPAETALAGETTASAGLAPAPVVVHNVETLVRVASIVRTSMAGGDVTSELGGAATFLATVTGDVARHDVVELPIGVSLLDVIDEVGGCPTRPILALNGVSYPMIPAARFDLALEGRAIDGVANPIGAGAFRVYDETHDPLAIAAAAARFLGVESCGQCRPCKTDGLSIAACLAELATGGPVDDRAAGRLEELSATVAEGARCGLAAQEAAVVDSLLAWFPGALATAGQGPTELIAPLQRIVEGRAEIDPDHAAVQPDWTTEQPWAGRTPVEIRMAPSS